MVLALVIMYPKTEIKDLTGFKKNGFTLRATKHYSPDSSVISVFGGLHGIKLILPLAGCPNDLLRFLSAFLSLPYDPVIRVGQIIIQYHKLQSSVIFLKDQDKGILLPVLMTHAQVKEHVTLSVSSTWQWHSLYTCILVTRYFKPLKGVVLASFTVPTAEGIKLVITKTY